MFAGPLVGIFKTVSGGPRLAADGPAASERWQDGTSDLVFERAHLKEGTLYI